MTEPKKNDDPLHVLSLSVENILRVEAVYIEPNGRLIEITGKNRQGKSSTLEALWMAFGGEKSVPPAPIRKGKTEGKIVVNLGSAGGDLRFVVTRRIKRREDGTIAQSLTIENAEGHRLQKPQEILNQMIGPLSVDPLEFIGMPAKNKIAVLKKLVPGVDFDAMDEASTADFNRRTDVNREAKALLAQGDAVLLPADLPAARVDEAGLMARLKNASVTNAAIEAEHARRRTVQDTLDRAEKNISKLLEEIARLSRMVAESQEVVSGLHAEIEAWEPVSDPIDTADTAEKLQQARYANAILDKADGRRAILIMADAKVAESEELTAAIEKRNAEKAAAIAAANLPIDGLSFDQDEVLLNGFPLSQASGAEKLRVSVAVAAAMNQRLRFVRIRDGSLLDDESWAELGRLAEEMKLQIFAETVASGRPSAVVIEDGHVLNRTATGAAA